MSKSLLLNIGERVEAYRENTPSKVEWFGMVDRVRRHTSVVVAVDNKIVRTGTFVGQPVRISFACSGGCMEPTYGPQLLIRRIAT